MWAPLTATVIVVVEVPKKAMVMGILVILLAICAAIFMAASSYVVMYIREMRAYYVRSREIIVIEDSPMPTKRMVTPRSRTPMSATRAGRSRVRKHVRACTRVFNPKRKGHCAFKAILHAAGVQTTMKSISTLRAKTAELFEQACIHDEEIAGVRARDLVVQEGLTLAAYKVRVSEDMWASVVEAALAAKVVGISLIHKHKEQQVCIGEGPLKGLLHLKAHHYMLYKVHRRMSQTTHSSMTRGGMQNDESLHEQRLRDMRRNIMTVPLTYAFDISPVGAQGARMIMRREDTVGAMRVGASMALGVPTSAISIMEGDEMDEALPDWVQPPDTMHLRRNTQAALHFRLHIEGTQFTMHPHLTWTHEHVLEQLSRLLNVLPHFLELYMDGEPWIYQRAPTHGEIEIRTPYRGGMRRSLSTTVPFTGQQGSGSSSDSPPLPARYEARPRSSRSRSRDTRRVEQGVRLPEYWANVLPASPPPAQDDYISRMATDMMRPVGHVHALPQVQPQQVMRYMREGLDLEYLPRYLPMDARRWEDVAQVLMEPQPPLNVGVYEDLRYSIWERYQQPRVMAAVSQGRAVSTLVIPERLPMEQAQARVDQWGRSTSTWDVI